MKRLTTEDFIRKAGLKHNEKYDYSKVEYVNNSTKVKIICPEHGEFEQAPYKHINRSQECPKCGRNKSDLNRRKGLEYFIEKAKEKHGNRYNYSKVEYKTNSTKVKIVCTKHGEFEQIPENHYISGCAKCAGNTQKTTEAFIEDANKIHNNKYDYSNSVYTKAFNKVKIICPEHGEFEQTPDAHVNAKSGCPYCGSGGTYSEWYFENNPYKKNQAAIFYIINMKSETEEFIKIGITIKSAHFRFRSPSKNGGYKYSVIKEIKMPLYDAWKIEQEILSNFKEDKYMPENYFPGHLECLDKNSLNIIMAGIL